MEIDSLAERILCDINAVFRRDPNIDEFDIIPVLDAQNKSPVIHEGHKFALEAWCVKHVYYYCYNRLMEWKEQKKKADSSTVLQWSVAILLINPDVQMVWNVRKEMIISGHLLPKDELNFTAIVLTRKPKCADIFSQRKWLLLNLLKKEHWWNNERKNEIVRAEFEICGLAANKYPNNYHAWSHRIWIVQKLIVVTQEILHKELESNKEWITCHVSEHSGLQYRQFLFDLLASWDKRTQSDRVGGGIICVPSDNRVTSVKNGKEENANRFLLPPGNEAVVASVVPSIGKLLRDELELVSGLQTVFDGHEALWYHRRYVLHSMNREGLLHCGRSRSTVANLKIGCNLLGPTYKKTKLENTTVPNRLPVHTLEKEVAFLEESVSKCENDAAHLGLLVKYKRWLELITGITLHGILNNSKNHHQF